MNPSLKTIEPVDTGEHLFEFRGKSMLIALLVFSDYQDFDISIKRIDFSYKYTLNKSKVLCCSFIEEVTVVVLEKHEFDRNMR